MYAIRSYYARIEYLAYQEFPGLRKLWLSFFTAQPDKNDEYGELHETMDFMVRTTRAIMDPDYTDPADFINETAAEFLAELQKNPLDSHISWMAGVRFYSYNFV